MQCTHCKYPDSRVVYTMYDNDNRIVRRRECIKCGVRYTTQEDLRTVQKRNAASTPINDRSYP